MNIICSVSRKGEVRISSFCGAEIFEEEK